MCLLLFFGLASCSPTVAMNFCHLQTYKLQVSYVSISTIPQTLVHTFRFTRRIFSVHSLIFSILVSLHLHHRKRDLSVHSLIFSVLVSLHLHHGKRDLSGHSLIFSVLVSLHLHHGKRDFLTIL